MLPNWLYGKSKSKLASILGGGGSTPADYDQVKAQVTQNAEDILGLSNALDGKAALTQISNPNLLDNPWFTVNQRGEGSYTSMGYTVDRWLLDNGNGEVTVGNSGIQLINSDTVNYSAIHQRFTSSFSSQIMGRTVTASVLLSDGSIISDTVEFTFPSGVDYLNVLDIDENSQLALRHITSLGLYEILINAKPNKTSPVIRAVKLEAGSVSTLAMDVAPNYQQELAKCERYFQRISGDAYYAFALALAVNTVNADFNIALPTGMISQPTISKSGNIMLTDGVSIIDLDSITIVNYTKGIGSILNMRVAAASGSSLTSGKIYKVAFNSSGAYLDFSAEL